MHAFTIVSALFAAAAIATPTPNNNVGLKPRTVADIHAQAKELMDAKAADGCEVVKCVAALAPTAAACAAALAEGGLNPIADAACFAAGLNSAVNTPESCNGCAD